MTIYKIDTSSNKQELAKRTSDEISKYLLTLLKKKERVQIAISGGSTPCDVYKLLSKENIAWERIDVFLADERWVDPKDPLSNSLMIRDTLLYNTPGSLASFYEVVTTQLPTPEASAIAFEELIKEKCIGTPPVFDLILLGLGEDGHTASLFPYTDSLEVLNQWTTVGRGKGQDRITLTVPVLSAAKKIIFLVSGSSKQIALKRLIDPLEPTYRTPAKLVNPSTEILVLADKSATDLI